LLTTDESAAITGVNIHTPIPQEVNGDPIQVTNLNPPFDPLSTPSNVGIFPSQGNGDWDMQDLVWSNLPWDFNLMDETAFMDGAGNQNWGGWEIPAQAGDAQIVGNAQG
jgi:hypothetical protein